jgi:putative transposase
MHFEPGVPYHVYNRGINKQTIFFTARNYRFFLDKVRKEWAPFCTLEKFCLMPNHYHFICIPTAFGCEEILIKGTPSCLQRFSRRIGHTQASYANAINNERGTTGPLFKKKTRSKLLLTDYEIGGTHHDYYSTCGDYIEMNPVVAGLVTKAELWPWSSATTSALIAQVTIDK